MCSWGEIAVGESRHTADRPSRSALLGLAGAALGVERSDEEGQQALSAAWRFGLKILSSGTLLRDFHTVQAPRKERRVVHRTRRQELSGAVFNTLLSSREYRLDSVSVVAAEATPEARWTLENLQSALRSPCFTLYLGRKSCPLAVPLAPQVVEAPDLLTALNAPHLALAELAQGHRQHHNTVSSADPSQPAWPSATDTNRLRLGTPRIYWEQGMVPAENTKPGGSMSPSIEFMRHDQPLSRRRWQFASRREWGYTPESKG